MKNSRPVLTVLTIILSIGMFCACNPTLFDYKLMKIYCFFHPSACIIPFYAPTPKMVLSIIEKNEENLKLFETFSPTGNMKLRSAKSKYKYKKDRLDQAQQGWTIKGEFDTAQTAFYDTTPIRIQAGTGTGDSPDQIDHSFTPDKVSKNGKSCKAKFKYLQYKSSKNGKAPKSKGHHWVSLGLFSGRIKNGKLRYAYNIKKANEAGLMKTTGFDDIKDYWANSAESNKVESAGFVHSKVKIGADDKKADSMMKIKATKKGAKGKVKPSE